MQSVTYDGFFFTPGSEDDELELSFFDYKDEKLKNAEKVENTAVGDMYHIAFFKPDEEGFVHFDESFEAIFADLPLGRARDEPDHHATAAAPADQDAPRRPR